KVVEVLTTLKEIAPKVDTVYSIDLAVRYEADGSVPIRKAVEEAGFELRPNGKVNVGMVSHQQGR
ncbi:MAG: hypothetical protein ACYC66_05375, partial [Chloroflexota bacterium]